MLDLGVIEPSTSEWHSPVILVPKPNWSCQFCINFRRVHLIFRFDAYPMPQVDDHLTCLREAQYISTLILTKGYWQVSMEPGSKEKTAFATPKGLYQFTRMLFVLHRAPATFLWLMDQLL